MDPFLQGHAAPGGLKLPAKRRTICSQLAVLFFETWSSLWSCFEGTPEGNRTEAKGNQRTNVSYEGLGPGPTALIAAGTCLGENVILGTWLLLTPLQNV